MWSVNRNRETEDRETEKDAWFELDSSVEYWSADPCHNEEQRGDFGGGG